MKSKTEELLSCVTAEELEAAKKAVLPIIEESRCPEDTLWLCVLSYLCAKNGLGSA